MPFSFPAVLSIVPGVTQMVQRQCLRAVAHNDKRELEKRLVRLPSHIRTTPSDFTLQLWDAAFSASVPEHICAVLRTLPLSEKQANEVMLSSAVHGAFDNILALMERFPPSTTQATVLATAFIGVQPAPTVEQTLCFVANANLDPFSPIEEVLGKNPWMVAYSSDTTLFSQACHRAPSAVILALINKAPPRTSPSGKECRGLFSHKETLSPEIFVALEERGVTFEKICRAVFSFEHVDDATYRQRLESIRRTYPTLVQSVDHAQDVLQAKRQKAALTQAIGTPLNSVQPAPACPAATTRRKI